MLNPGRHCLWKQCRSRSDGFWRSHLMRIYSVWHSVCKFLWTNNIELFDWLTVRNGCGKLNLFGGIMVNYCLITDSSLQNESVLNLVLLTVNSAIRSGSHGLSLAITDFIEDEVCRLSFFKIILTWLKAFHRLHKKNIHKKKVKVSCVTRIHDP